MTRDWIGLAVFFAVLVLWQIMQHVGAAPDYLPHCNGPSAFDCTTY